jgi:hypothetical protein
MPYDAPGERDEVVAVRELAHGAPCVVGNQVGFAAKVTQLDRFTAPTSDEATTIEVGEVFVLFTNGVHEIALEAPFAAAAVGAKLWIDPDDDSVDDVAAEGDLPLGVIVEVDAARTPDVARVNLNAWQAFLPTPAP